MAVKFRNIASFFLWYLLVISLYIPTLSLRAETLYIDVYTNKGGLGSDTNGGKYVFGETVIFYFYLNSDVDRARAILYYPDGSTRLIFDQPLVSGTYDSSGIAGGMEGRRRLVFEAWLGNQYAIDVVEYLVVPPTYSYTISVSGLETYTTDVYLDGVKKLSLRDGEYYTFTDLSGTHTISVKNIVEISSKERLICEQYSITVRSSGSHTFRYKKQYYLDVSVKPSNSGRVSMGSGWYDSGSSLNIKAEPYSGYRFRKWVGDMESTYNTISFTLTNPIKITAWFGRENTISFMLSKNTVTRLDALELYGQIEPSPGYSVNVRAIFIPPYGVSKVISAWTDNRGYYNINFKPDISGIWSVYVAWDGDEQYLPAESMIKTFVVNPRSYSFSIDSNIRSEIILITIDGTNIRASDLPKVYKWEEFTSHEISIIQREYQESDDVKYLFYKWNDGEENLRRSFKIDKDMDLKALFRKQYRIRVASDLGRIWVDEGEWCEEGSVISIRVSGTKHGFLIVDRLAGFEVSGNGTKHYENLERGELRIEVNGPVGVRAVWRKDYTGLIIFIVVLLVISVVLIYIYPPSRIKLRTFISTLIRKKNGTRVVMDEKKEGTKVVSGEKVPEEYVRKLEAELEKTREYLSKLEEEKKKGVISEQAYHTLKKEYQSKIEWLEKEVEKIRKQA